MTVPHLGVPRWQRNALANVGHELFRSQAFCEVALYIAAHKEPGDVVTPKGLSREMWQAGMSFAQTPQVQAALVRLLNLGCVSAPRTSLPEEFTVRDCTAWSIFQIARLMVEHVELFTEERD